MRLMFDLKRLTKRAQIAAKFADEFADVFSGAESMLLPARLRHWAGVPWPRPHHGLPHVRGGLARPSEHEGSLQRSALHPRCGSEHSPKDSGARGAVILHLSTPPSGVSPAGSTQASRSPLKMVRAGAEAEQDRSKRDSARKHHRIEELESQLRWQEHQASFVCHCVRVSSRGTVAFTASSSSIT